MKEPSPFQAAETIRDIGSPLPTNYRGEPYRREEHSAAAQAWVQRVDGPLPARVENAAFFHNNMFDTQLLAVKGDANRVLLTVDEDDAHAFSNALRFFFDLPSTTSRYPVDLIMHDPLFVRAATYDDQGYLQDVEIVWDECAVGLDMGTLTNEWFFDWGDHIGWVAETWGIDYVGNEGKGTTYILIDCDRASAHDRRLETLEKEFGPSVKPLWEDAQREFKKGEGARLFWDENLYDYLPGRLIAHGLTRDDFILSAP